MAHLARQTTIFQTRTPHTIPSHVISTTQHRCEDGLGFNFLHDNKHPRKYLLDTGSNLNLIDSDQLTIQEQKRIDTKTIIRITGFNRNSPIIYSLGKVHVQIYAEDQSLTIPFDVMLLKTFTYNLIGVLAIQQHFLPFLLKLSNPLQPEHCDYRPFLSLAHHDSNIR